MRTLDVLTKVNDICIVGHDTIDAENLFEVSLKNTLALFNAKRGSIYLLNEATDELTLQKSVGVNLAQEKLFVKRLGHGIIGQVAESKKPILVEDITKDARFKNYKSRDSYKTPSFVCAPLMLKDKLIGIINISDKESGVAFSSDDVDLIDFVASQIALNYQRIHLNQHYKKSLSETQNLQDRLGKLATIGKLTGGIAHEFNNPLDGVLRYTNLSLEHLGEDNPVVREYLLEVRQGLMRMVNIVKSLLACARNSYPSSLGKTDVNRSAEQIIKELGPHLFHKNIVLKRNMQKNMPRINDLGIERIFSNLLTNAIDAVENKGTILVETSFDGKYFRLIVADNGKGITKENLDNVFEPFFTTKGIDQGCGLGLTIVSEIVKHYKGDIRIETSPKKGAKFTVILPADED